MGRYYSGDIEGKFMFGVQSSNAPTRFYATECDPGHIEYNVSFDDYDKVKKELDSINKGSINRVEKMFSECEGYNEDTKKLYNVSTEDLSEYADYQLGKKIISYFDENECDCWINAEL